MSNNRLAIGLVLAGGGARGAYHVGVLDYLVEIGISPVVMAGASIGALNGAVLASIAQFSEGVRHLAKFWERIGQDDIIRKASGRKIANDSTSLLKNSFGVLDEAGSIFDIGPIEELFNEAVNISGLRKGPELWVSVFRSNSVRGFLGRSLDYVYSFAGQDSDWFLAQSFEDDAVVRNVLLASAAIPIAFPRRSVNGLFYVDGGLGDNLPVRPVAARKCNLIITIHLSGGGTFSRHEFSDIPIVEIRPSTTINKGLLGGIFDFSLAKIEELRFQGYRDARDSIEEIGVIYDVISKYRQANATVKSNARRLLNDPI